MTAFTPGTTYGDDYEETKGGEDVDLDLDVEGVGVGVGVGRSAASDVDVDESEPISNGNGSSSSPPPSSSSARPVGHHPLSSSHVNIRSTFSSLFTMNHPIFHGMVRSLPEVEVKDKVKGKVTPPSLHLSKKSMLQNNKNDILRIVVESIDGIMGRTSSGSNSGGAHIRSRTRTRSRSLSHLLDPVIRIHVCDETTGRYISSSRAAAAVAAGSSRSRRISRRGRGQGQMDAYSVFVGPMGHTLTSPTTTSSSTCSSTTLSSSLSHKWNDNDGDGEAIVMMTTEPYARILNGRTILLFEVLDRDIFHPGDGSSGGGGGSSGGGNEDVSRIGDDKMEESAADMGMGMGMARRTCVAWAFLRPISSNHGNGDGDGDIHVNVGVKKKDDDDEEEEDGGEGKNCQLQLFQCQRDTWFVQRYAKRLLGLTNTTNGTGDGATVVPNVYLQYLREKRNRVPMDACLSIKIGPMKNPMIVERVAADSSTHHHHQPPKDDDDSRHRSSSSSSSETEGRDGGGGRRLLLQSHDADPVPVPRRRKILRRFARQPHDDCKIPDTLLLRLCHEGSDSGSGGGGGGCSGVIVSFNHSGDLLAVASTSTSTPIRHDRHHYYQLYIYDINHGSLFYESTRCHHDRIVSICWSQDDSLVICASLDGMISIHSIMMVEEEEMDDETTMRMRMMMMMGTDTATSSTRTSTATRRGNKCIEFIYMESIPKSLMFWQLNLAEYAAANDPSSLIIVGCGDGSVVSLQKQQQQQGSSRRRQPSLAPSSSWDNERGGNGSNNNFGEPLLLGGRKYHLNAAVNAMTCDYSNGRLYTGDEKGCIIIWKPKMTSKGGGVQVVVDFEVLSQLDGLREIGGRSIINLSINHHRRRRRPNGEADVDVNEDGGDHDNGYMYCRGKKLLITLEGEKQMLWQYDFSVHEVSSFCICSEAKKAHFSIAQYSPDARYVLGGTVDGKIYFLDASGIKKKTSHDRVKLDQSITSISWSPTAHMIAIAYNKDLPILVYVTKTEKK